jgi:hypothetical protein
VSDHSPVRTMKAGDIFRWRWTDEVERRIREHSHDAYWCRSCIATFDGETLRDTFWGSDSDGRLDLDRVTLTFLGNANEMKTIYPGERVFYRDEDVVSMQHSNNSGAPVYVKAGRDAATMKAYYAYQGERAESEIEWMQRRIAECSENIARIDAGDIDGVFSIWSERR